MKFFTIILIILLYSRCAPIDSDQISSTPSETMTEEIESGTEIDLSNEVQNIEETERKDDNIYFFSQNNFQSFFPNYPRVNQIDNDAIKITNYQSEELFGEDDIISYLVTFSTPKNVETYVSNLKEDDIKKEIKDYIIGNLITFKMTPNFEQASLFDNKYISVNFTASSSSHDLRSIGKCFFKEGTFVQLKIIYSEYYRETAQERYNNFVNSFKLVAN